MASWPNNLPKFRATGAQFVPGKRGKRFEVDEGPAKQRGVNTKSVETATLQLRCTVGERAIFDDFYADVSGGDWFDNFKHPRTGAMTQARFVVGKEPNYTADVPYWLISVTVEIQ
jgi:hypothetical protein